MKKYKDQGFLFIDELMDRCKGENKSQLAKWGVQNRTAFEWITYLTEEVGELAEAVSEREYRDGTDEAVIKEAIQTATLALKIAEMYEVQRCESSQSKEAR